MPYTEPVGGASLAYRWRMPQGGASDRFPAAARMNDAADAHQDSVKVHIIVKSTLDYLNKGGLTYTVSLDGGEARRVNFNHNLNEAKENIYTVFYPTVARRVVESTVTLPIDNSKAEHQLVLCPEDPAIVFEKIVIDAGGYRPSFLFSDEGQGCVTGISLLAVNGRQPVSAGHCATRCPPHSHLAPPVPSRFRPSTQRAGRAAGR